MSFTPETFAAMQKAQIESLRTLAFTAFAGTERLAALNLGAFRSLIEEGSASASAVLNAKDLQELVALQTSYAQPAVEKAIQWSRSIYEITAETGEEIKKTVESQLADAGQSLSTSLDQLVKQAPPGADSAVSASVTAIKTALGAANTAYETLTKTTRQFADYAEAGISAAAPKAAKPKKAA